MTLRLTCNEGPLIHTNGSLRYRAIFIEGEQIEIFLRQGARFLFSACFYFGVLMHGGTETTYRKEHIIMSMLMNL